MSAVGFDLGNSNCVVAVCRQRGIDVALNQESKRESSAVISFSGRQRLIGSAASASAVMNPSNSITQIKRLIGRRFSDLKDDDLGLLPFKVTEGPDGFPLVNVQYLGIFRTFTPTQLLGMLLSHLKSLAEKHLNSPVEDCCIGIPAFFSDSQRRAVLDAAAIAGLRPLQLIHESTAVAIEYGFYKTDLPHRNGEELIVAFVDVGHASTQVCIVAFRKDQLRVLAHSFDSSLGGRDFDKVLFRHFASQFKEKTKIDISSNGRACVRLNEACEKLKKTLSANLEAPLNVECLVEDNDFRGFIGREEFEQIGENILKRVRVLLERVFDNLGIGVEDVQVVEVVGSGSRVPAIVQIVKDFFGKEPRRTMNASECVARGCALQCAMLSPTFKVREFKVHDILPFNIDVLLKVPSPGCTTKSDKIGKSIRAFSNGNSIPMTKSLRLYGQNPFFVDLVYPDASELGVSEMINHCKIFCSGTTKVDTTALEIKVSLDHHGILSVDSATMVEEVKVSAKTIDAVEASDVESNDASHAVQENLDLEGEEMVNHQKASNEKASKAKKIKDTVNQPTATPGDIWTEGAAEATNAKKCEAESSAQDSKDHSENEPLETRPEVKVVKDLRIHDLLCEYIHCGLSPTDLQKLIEEEQGMALQDKMVEETKDSKNAVETYVYDMRNKINDKYRDFVTDADRNDFSTKLQEAEDWLYEEGEDALKAVYIEKLKGLKMHGDPIEMRYKETSDRQSAATQLYNCIYSFQNAVLSNDPRLDHVEIVEKQKVLEACQKAQNWLNQNWQEQSALPKHADPIFLCANITKYTQEFDSYCKNILLKSKPDVFKRQKSPQETPKPSHTPAKGQPPAEIGNGTKQPSADKSVEPPAQTDGEDVPSSPAV